MNNYQPPIPPDPKKQCKDCERFGYNYVDSEYQCVNTGAFIDRQGTCDNWEAKKTFHNPKDSS